MVFLTDDKNYPAYSATLISAVLEYRAILSGYDKHMI